MSNYREIPALIAARSSFEGNSMSAFTDYEGNYVVMSYATVISVRAPDGGITINERKYSQTTTRHQNLVRENLR